MATLIVTYPLTPGSRFDVDYYVTRHMPLVREKWTRLGLVVARALLPDQDAPPFAAIALLTFADRAAIEAALASPEAGDIFGDLPNFTDIAPQPMFAREG